MIFSPPNEIHDITMTSMISRFSRQSALQALKDDIYAMRKTTGMRIILNSSTFYSNS